MLNKALVSIIIPAFNAEKYIADTLDSILAQTHPNVEVIVVDDGSTDGTAKIVRDYGPRVAYYFQYNRGSCAVPRNTGLGISSGDFICFSDADDLMMPDRISIQLDFLMRHPESRLVFSDYCNFDKNGWSAKTQFQTCPQFWNLVRDRREIVIQNACLHLAKENFGITGSFLFHRSLLKMESAFEPTLTSCEDFHFYFRLARHTPVGIIKKVGMLHRIHGNNLSSNIYKMCIEGIRSRSLLRDSERNPEVKKYLDRFIAKRCRNLARIHADRGDFSKVIQYDWAALRGPFFRSDKMKSCRNILRNFVKIIYSKRENSHPGPSVRSTSTGGDEKRILTNRTRMENRFGNISFERFERVHRSTEGLERFAPPFNG
jgi:glycosyltransferase involved in cell wall biosynthesis